MKIAIYIDELEAGDVSVRVACEAGVATARESLYAESIARSVLNHLKGEIPRIGKKLGAKGTIPLNVNPRNS